MRFSEVKHQDTWKNFTEIMWNKRETTWDYYDILNVFIQDILRYTFFSKRKHINISLDS